MKTGDLLDYSVEFYKRYIKTFWKMVAIFHAPITFLFFFLIDYGNIFQNFINFAEEGEFAFFKIILIYIGLLIYNLYSITILHVLTLGSIKFTYEAYVKGNMLGARESLKVGIKRFLWYILYLFLQSTVGGGVFYIFYIIVLFLSIFLMNTRNILAFIVLISIFILIALAIYLYFFIRLFFVPHALVIEGGEPLFAIKMSWKLTKKNFFKVLWPIFFANILSSSIPSLIGSVVQILPIDDPLTKRIGSAIVMGASSFLYPFTFILSTIVFIGLKERKGLIELEKEIGKLIEGQADKISLNG